jgi:DNA helicase-2/ATP-dependent DNA helicase PcrA
VSPLQQRLLDLWLGDRDDVCVVGDPAQTIYSFAGARSDNLVQFPRRYPDARVVRLVRDYRSTPQVVAVANAVLRRGRDAAATSAVTLRAQRPDGPDPVYAEHPDEIAEAAWVAEEIRRLVAAGTPPREVAVLYRVNAQSEAYEKALADAGIHYVVRGAERFFERAEVKQAGMLLRAAVRAGDAGTDAPDAAAATAAVLSSAGFTELPPPGGSAARDRWESLKAVVDLAAEVVARKPRAGLAEVVVELEGRAAAQHAPVADGVTLASLHAAKGLEWDAVFIVGCHDGMLPLVYAETPAEIAEERRLFYVGVTRSRAALRISWSLSRTPGGQGNRLPSRFLDGVRPASVGAAGVAARRRGNGMRGPARCKVCRSPLTTAAERKVGRCSSCPGSMDDELFENLRAWRLDRAQEQKVPAFVVFTDATLVAIAESLPTDLASLAAVPGVGRAKLDRYGSEVLELCSRAAKKRVKK